MVGAASSCVLVFKVLVDGLFAIGANPEMFETSKKARRENNLFMSLIARLFCCFSVFCTYDSLWLSCCSVH